MLHIEPIFIVFVNSKDEVPSTMHAYFIYDVYSTEIQDHKAMNL